MDIFVCVFAGLSWVFSHLFVTFTWYSHVLVCWLFHGKACVRQMLLVIDLLAFIDSSCKNKVKIKIYMNIQESGVVA